MDNQLTNNPTIIKSCRTCEHRDTVGHCGRVGWMCSTEMNRGTICNVDGELVLWIQRLGIFPRMGRFLFGG